MSRTIRARRGWAGSSCISDNPDVIGSSGRTRTYNPPVNSRVVISPRLVTSYCADGLLVPCKYIKGADLTVNWRS